MRVKAYKNLHTGTYSIQNMQSKVIGHPTEVLLRDVEFRVQPGTRDRVRREKRRAVHAFVIGELIKGEKRVCGKWRAFRYNPYLFDTFVFTDTEKPVLTAEWVLLDEKGAWCIPHAHGSLTSTLATPMREVCIVPQAGGGTLDPGHTAQGWNG